MKNKKHKNIIIVIILTISIILIGYISLNGISNKNKENNIAEGNKFLLSDPVKDPELKATENNNF